MQRKLYVFCLALLMVSFVPRSHAQRHKSEIAFGYGYYSSFSFANHGMNSAPYNTSAGTWALNYRYYLNRNVTLGLGFGVENISSWGSFVTIAPEMTFCYMDTREDYIRVRLYGSVSMGVTVLTDHTLGYGEADESGLKLWGFQGTPFGMRIGRQFAGFIEVGYGYKGLIHGGLALRFPRILASHRRLD